MAFCERCGNIGASKRTDLPKEPVLCDKCYGVEVYGECNCDYCNNSYWEGDKLRCSRENCSPEYELE